MIDRFLLRLREPGTGVAVMTAVVSLLMAAHWPPMALPGLVVLGLVVGWPSVGLRPAVWWVFAVLWFGAVLWQLERMEDHVHLFSVWLVVMALSLAGGGSRFLERARGQGRVLLGTTFAVAVLWKLLLGQFVDGTALWTFLVVDDRFAPLADSLRISSAALADGREGMHEVVAGAVTSYDPPADVLTRVAVVAVLTLLLEAAVAVSHLVPDGHLLARLRLPSLVTFGLVTYSVVPVLPFAALLSVLAMVVAGWRREVMWVFPLLLLVSLGRALVLQG